MGGTGVEFYLFAKNTGLGWAYRHGWLLVPLAKSVCRDLGFVGEMIFIRRKFD